MAERAPPRKPAMLAGPAWGSQAAPLPSCTEMTDQTSGVTRRARVGAEAKAGETKRARRGKRGARRGARRGRRWIVARRPAATRQVATTGVVRRAAQAG